ncbi:MAG TPA: GNAT family N-acetyltransferase [Pyrinomonadaceae bacterium]|jgi:predicted GNAT superfamily acetyltransferase
MNPERPEETEIEIRECATIEEFDECVRLQREAFGLPDIELSPRRHLIVSRKAGGWTLAAFDRGRMVGFVHQMAAVRDRDLLTGYSHMMAVARDYQNRGVGARLKWAQRARALEEGRTLINWTWDPMQARNAHFNLNRLGAVVRSYAVNFYGTDYITLGQADLEGRGLGIDSDRLFADWDLNSKRVAELASGQSPTLMEEARAAIEIPPDWSGLLRIDAAAARREQLRVRAEFEQAFAAGLVCAAFARDAEHPRYLLFHESSTRE